MGNYLSWFLTFFLLVVLRPHAVAHVKICPVRCSANLTGQRSLLLAKATNNFFDFRISSNLVFDEASQRKRDGRIFVVSSSTYLYRCVLYTNSGQWSDSNRCVL